MLDPAWRRLVFTQTTLSCPSSFNLISVAWPTCKGYSGETSEPNYAIKGSRLITDNTFYLLRLPTPGGRCGVAHAHRRRDETVVTAHIRSRCRNTASPCSQSRFIPGSLRRLVPHSRLVDLRWSIRHGRGIRMRLWWLWSVPCDAFTTPD